MPNAGLFHSDVIESRRTHMVPVHQAGGSRDNKADGTLEDGFRLRHPWRTCGPELDDLLHLGRQAESA
eukprot:scaffold241276_cov27-Prasinocladus_malaysianus.AAC.2